MTGTSTFIFSAAQKVPADLRPRCVTSDDAISTALLGRVALGAIDCGLADDAPQTR